MKVRNPSYDETGGDRALYRDALVAYVTASRDAVITFDDLRAQVPAGKREKFTDAELHRLCIEAGLEVVE